MKLTRHNDQTYHVVLAYAVHAIKNALSDEQKRELDELMTNKSAAAGLGKNNDLLKLAYAQVAQRLVGGMSVKPEKPAEEQVAAAIQSRFGGASEKETSDNIYMALSEAAEAILKENARETGKTGRGKDKGR